VNLIEQCNPIRAEEGLNLLLLLLLLAVRIHERVTVGLFVFKPLALLQVDDHIQWRRAPELLVDHRHALIDLGIGLEVVNEAVFHGQLRDTPIQKAARSALKARILPPCAWVNSAT